MAEDLTGRQLGHYRIDGVLGRGGMSVLYRATDVRLGRGVALKVMGEHITGDPEFRARFVDEARNTSAIDHANVVPLYDFGEVDGLLFIALRLVDGVDLAGLLADGPISARRALDLLGQVAEALDLLHERGLVHLDLKPANVLVTSRESASGPGSAEHAYLADFGLTRRGATGHRTTGGDFLGSPDYAAPEHLRDEPVDGRTDQYALACVLFACLTGLPPFPGRVQEVVQGHLLGEPPAVTSLVVLPRAVDAVLRRGMAKRAEERFEDCRSLIAAARDALASAVGEPGPIRVGPAGSPDSPPVSPSAGTPVSVDAPTGSVAVSPSPVSPPPVSPTDAVAGAASGGADRPFPPAPSFARSGSFRQPQDDPVRLRPPMPAAPSSFSPSSFVLPSTRGRRGRWLLPLLVLAALSAIVAVFVVLGGRSPR